MRWLAWVARVGGVRRLASVAPVPRVHRPACVAGARLGAPALEVGWSTELAETCAGVSLAAV
ncbi:hypothetical protein ACIBO5_36655 [Nonomuraea angiospora]|uniref:hypothetical protein n=1 Tax=Nonomuraea angiospora TaxID=46172 RepID=UPI0037B8591B